MFTATYSDGPNIFAGMAQATLTITIPEGVWIGDVTRDHPAATLRILAAHAAEDGTGVGLAEITAPALVEVVTAIDEREEVSDLEVLQRYEDTALVQFETSAPLLLLPLMESGVPLTMPFEIEDGTAVWELTAPQHRLSELADRLEEFGIPYTVEALQQQVEPTQLLTAGQLDLVAAAVELGYYDTPRECTLTELADARGIAKSTASETLHRAEGAIVKRFVEEAEGSTVELSD